MILHSSRCSRKIFCSGKLSREAKNLLEIFINFISKQKKFVMNGKRRWCSGGKTFIVFLTSQRTRKDKKLRTKIEGWGREVWVIFPVAFCDGNYFKVFSFFFLFRRLLVETRKLFGHFCYEWVEVREGENHFNYKRQRRSFSTFFQSFLAHLQNPPKGRHNRWKKCHYHAEWLLLMISQCIHPFTEKNIIRFASPCERVDGAKRIVSLVNIHS